MNSSKFNELTNGTLVIDAVYEGDTTGDQILADSCARFWCTTYNLSNLPSGLFGDSK